MLKNLRMRAVLFLVTTVIVWNDSSAANGDNGPATLEQAREQVDSRGRITDEDLRERTGWQTMHAFQWAIELEQPSGSTKFVSVSKKRVFRHGDAFRLRIETATDLYVYVLVRNADASEKILLPEAAESVPLVRRGSMVFLPASPDTFTFTPPAGKERLRLVVSPMELPWVSSKRYWELENGDMLSDEQQAVLDQFKSVRSQGLGDEIKKLDLRAKSVDSLRGAQRQIEQGTLARGVEVISVEDVAEAELVSYATRLPDARPIIIHDIELEHAN